MEIVKVHRKYVIKGDGNSWIFNKTFPTKWKAEMAVEVFKEGGTIKDYWKRKKPRENNPIYRKPIHAYAIVEKALDEILQLNPTCDEIIAFSENYPGTWTHSNAKGFFRPRLHDTWGIKRGGRVHIDLGCAGHHVMLTKKTADVFIDFIKDKRHSFRNDK